MAGAMVFFIRSGVMHTQKDLEKIFRAMDLDTQKKRDERSDFKYTNPEDNKTEGKWFYYLDISTKSEDEEQVCPIGTK